MADLVARAMHRPTNLPYILLGDMLGDDPTSECGGIVIKMVAGAALNIGDVVYISAAATANKSTTASNHAKKAGVVVGGVRRSVVSSTMEASPRSGDVGKAAAAASGEHVLVLICGIAYVVAAAAVSAGDRLIPDTVTAGRVKVGADITATVNSGGTTVTSTAANGAIITVAGDGFNRILGVALDAAAGAASVFRALIY